MTTSLEQRVAAIETRNRRVEADKAWETSMFRTALIVFLTYAVVFLYESSRDPAGAWLNALVAVVGFYVSTQAFGVVKTWWIKRHGFIINAAGKE